MKKITVLLILLTSITLHAQVGVNTTTPDPSSMLDITATDKGVLVPRVSLNNVTTTMLDGVNTAATGLLIWNTNASIVGGNGVGFYFFNGTQWMPITQTNGGNTLNQSYNEGGAGAGREIEANNGAVRINGTDGFLVTGTFLSGNTIDSEITGPGIRMFFNPNKAAFRVGRVDGDQWDNSNIGNYSTAFGLSNTASGSSSTAFGMNNSASGLASTAFGYTNTASGGYSTAFGSANTASSQISTAFGIMNSASGFASTAFGSVNTASGLHSTAFGRDNMATDSASTAFGRANTASGWVSTAFGYLNTASGSNSIAFGMNNSASGSNSTAFGFRNIASGQNSTAFGERNSAPSFGETVLGIGATYYTESYLGSSQFGPANQNDRLLVVGNAIDLNENGTVDNDERRDALVILKNGNTGIGSSTPQERLHVVGNIRMVDGNQANGRVLKSDANGTASWQIDSDNQTLSFTGNNLSILNGNSVNLSSINTDNQTLTIAGSNLSILNGNSVNLSGINTDNQTLSLTGTNLSISGGNSVDLSSLSQGADNGLGLVTGNIGLGGTLNRSTQVDLSTFGISFNINSTGRFKVQNNGNETFNVLEDGSSFFSNRLAVGKTFASYMLDVAQTAENSTRAISSTKTDNTTSATNNIYASKTTNGNGVSTGFYNTTSGPGTGTKRGINNIINSTGNADQILILNELLSNNTSGMYYGVRNLISGASGSAAIGSDQQLTGNGLGAKTGINNNITGASNTQAYRGNLSTISGTGDGARIGTDNSISTTGNGIHYGTRNQLSGNGNGFKYGTYNLLDAEGGIQYGTYNEISGNGTTQYGTYNVLNGTGIKYGTYNSVNVNQGWAGYFVGKSTFTNRLSIGSDDNPNTALHINKNSSTTYAHIELTHTGLATGGSRIRFNSSAETDNEWVLFARTNNDANTSRLNFFHTGAGDILRIFGSGRVGIMRNPGTNALEVAGEASKTTAGGWVANSDRRLKKNIATISTNEALDKILKLRGVTYLWNDDKTGTERPKELQMGFIAQEIAEIFPEKVTEDNLGYLQTAYGDYDPIIFQAIKALHDKIERLEKENETLHSALKRIEALESLLNTAPSK